MNEESFQYIWYNYIISILGNFVFLYGKIDFSEGILIFTDKNGSYSIRQTNEILTNYTTAI